MDRETLAREDIIVANAGPLIALAWLGQLDLLRRLFGEVCVPSAVWDETVGQSPDPAQAQAITTRSRWIRKVQVQNSLAVVLLLDELDPGESEAIVLAQELRAARLLMDERLGRRKAVQSGLKVTGTLGILVMAKRVGLVTEVKSLLDRLKEMPLYMSSQLYEEILCLAGER